MRGSILACISMGMYRQSVIHNQSQLVGNNPKRPSPNVAHNNVTPLGVVTSCNFSSTSLLPISPLSSVFYLFSYTSLHHTYTYPINSYIRCLSLASTLTITRFSQSPLDGYWREFLSFSRGGFKRPPLIVWRLHDCSTFWEL
jgi:hypothetical protein